VLPVTGILVAGYYCVLYAFLANGHLKKDKYKNTKRK
jgi:hypothetical protein